MEMYRVTQIEGKGFGVVATKFIKRGTLIFKEKPQMPCVDEPLPHLQMQPDSWKDYFKRVMSLFDQMSESDQEEYLKLHISHEREDVKRIRFLILMIEKDKAEKIQKIVGIYLTNVYFKYGLKIKASRFIHTYLHTYLLT